MDEDRRTSIRAWSEFAKLTTIMDIEMSAKAVFNDYADDILDTLDTMKAMEEEE